MIPGTFGTIRETLRHVVEAEQGYLSILTREPFSSKEAAEVFVSPDPLHEGPVPLDQLADSIRRMGPRWEALAKDADLAAREVTTTDGWRVPGSVPHGASHPPRRRPPQPHHVDPWRTRLGTARAQ